jgi:hypothetical protein
MLGVVVTDGWFDAAPIVIADAAVLSPRTHVGYNRRHVGVNEKGAIK